MGLKSHRYRLCRGYQTSSVERAATWTVKRCLSLVGMNEKGLTVGTTNIKTTGSKPGVGYLGLLHRLLQERSARAASHIVAQAPRSGAHVYWMADQNDLFEFETTPNHFVIRDADTRAVCHTNHCIAPAHQAIEGEIASDSSKARLSRLEQVLDTGKHDVSSIKDLFANRDDGLESINRYIEDDQGTATNSVFIGRPHQRIGFACRGPADRGQWYQLDFESDSPTQFQSETTPLFRERRGRSCPLTSNTNQIEKKLLDPREGEGV